MLDRTSSIPLHQQMEHVIRQNLADGIWPPGYLIPSENEFSREYGISRMTVRNVITKLVQEGLLFRIPGKGTYVSESKIVAKPLSYAGIRDQLEQMGYAVSTQLLSISCETVPDSIFRVFSLPSSTLFWKLIRIRNLKDAPLSLHTSYIPAHLCPDLEQHDLVNHQLCHLLSDQYGLHQHHTRETLESVSASQEEAELLKIKQGHPLLLLEDIILDEDNHPYEYTKVVFRGDRVTITLEF